MINTCGKLLRARIERVRPSLSTASQFGDGCRWRAFGDFAPATWQDGIRKRHRVAAFAPLARCCSFHDCTNAVLACWVLLGDAGTPAVWVCLLPWLIGANECLTKESVERLAGHQRSQARSMTSASNTKIKAPRRVVVGSEVYLESAGVGVSDPDRLSERHLPGLKAIPASLLAGISRQTTRKAVDIRRPDARRAAGASLRCAQRLGSAVVPF